MKKTALFLFIPLFVAMCSDTEPSSDEPAHEDIAGFPVEDFGNFRTPFLFIAMPCFEQQNALNPEGGGDAEVILYIANIFSKATLALNGEMLDLDHPNPMPMLIGRYPVTPGDLITYEVYIDGTYRSGQVEVPELLSVYYPDTLSLAEAPMVFWNQETDPDLFLTRLTGGESRFAPPIIDDVGGIEGDERQFTFQKDLFQSLILRDTWYLNAMVQAVNFEENEGMYMMASCYDVQNFESEINNHTAPQDTTEEKQWGHRP
ncbi:hypothetical protein QLX67_12925 [Balneolaceae bacterium ANBcel3]|nr:hypothetical protein [Balneolaceae bacterium ANBcel3]